MSDEGEIAMVSRVRRAVSFAAAIKSQDDAAVTAKFKALGETCASCHKTFPAQKYAD
jgi:cytochrome c556